MMDDLDRKEQLLAERLERVKTLEAEVKRREKALKEKEKKQMILRLSTSLWNDIAQWAEDDFRSINGQVEYLLSKCVSERKKNK